MAMITGGSVTFGRTVQPAQYESKKAEVTITFTVTDEDKPEDAVAMLNGASEMARTKALELIGLKSVASQAEGQRANATLATVADTADKTVPKTRTKKTEEPAKTSDADVLLPATEKPQISTGEERKDPAQSDPDGDLLGAATPQPVTDKELMDAVTKKNAEIANPKAIKEIREKFVATPKGIRDIPVDKRAEFLVELAKLKKT